MPDMQQLPPLLGAFGLVCAFVIYLLLTRRPEGEGRDQTTGGGKHGRGLDAGLAGAPDDRRELCSRVVAGGAAMASGVGVVDHDEPLSAYGVSCRVRAEVARPAWS